MPIHIKSRQAGFRRAGISHPDRWVEYPDGSLAADQVAALKAEPMLYFEQSVEPDTDLDDGNKGNGDEASIPRKSKRRE